MANYRWTDYQRRPFEARYFSVPPGTSPMPRMGSPYDEATILQLAGGRLAIPPAHPSRPTHQSRAPLSTPVCLPSPGR
jgi:hypothetical protein